MTRLLRYFSLFVMLFVAVGVVSAQEEESIRGLHIVKRKETIFGISRLYELSIEELLEANPEMKEPGYELKKGTVLKIPFAKNAGSPTSSSNPSSPSNPSNSTKAGYSSSPGISDRPIRLGVMLPLHDINGDGRRMVEYYRGVLMACDSLKKLGISVDVHAWNAALFEADGCDVEIRGEERYPVVDPVLYQCTPVGGQPSYLPGVSVTDGAE